MSHTERMAKLCKKCTRLKWWFQDRQWKLDRKWWKGTLQTLLNLNILYYSYLILNNKICVYHHSLKMRVIANAVEGLHGNFQLHRYKRCHDCKNYPLPQDRIYPVLKDRRHLTGCSLLPRLITQKSWAKTRTELRRLKYPVFFWKLSQTIKRPSVLQRFSLQENLAEFLPWCPT